MKLIALDLDGTVLNSKKEMSEENILAIKKAQQHGHIVMALSGRSHKSINSQLAKYGLECPVGASNGTTLFAVVFGIIEEINIASSSPFNLEVTHINGNKEMA